MSYPRRSSFVTAYPAIMVIDLTLITAAVVLGFAGAPPAHRRPSPHRGGGARPPGPGPARRDRAGSRLTPAIGDRGRCVPSTKRPCRKPDSRKPEGGSVKTACRAVIRSGSGCILSKHLRHIHGHLNKSTTRIFSSLLLPVCRAGCRVRVGTRNSISCDSRSRARQGAQNGRETGSKGARLCVVHARPSVEHAARQRAGNEVVGHDAGPGNHGEPTVLELL